MADVSFNTLDDTLKFLETVFRRRGSGLQSHVVESAGMTLSQKLQIPAVGCSDRSDVIEIEWATLLELQSMLSGFRGYLEEMVYQYEARGCMDTFVTDLTEQFIIMWKDRLARNENDGN